MNKLPAQEVNDQSLMPEPSASTPKPLLSVVIVTFESEKHIGECIRSLRWATERTSISTETIVVDNASSDSTLDVIQHVEATARVIPLAQNAGFAAACNTGFFETRGDYILYLNPDTRYFSGDLEKAIGLLRERPQIGLLGCRLLKPNGELDHACRRNFPSVTDALVYFTRLGRLFPDAKRLNRYTAGHLPDDEPANVDAINGAFMLTRRDAVEHVGPMDESYWMYGEDLDWCYRFKEQNYEVVYYPKLTFTHVKGASSPKGRSPKLNWAFHRAMWKFYFKYGKPGPLGLFNAVVLGGALVRYLLTTVSGAFQKLRSSWQRTRVRAAR